MQALQRQDVLKLCDSATPLAARMGSRAGIAGTKYAPLPTEALRGAHADAGGWLPTIATLKGLVRGGEHPICSGCAGGGCRRRT